MTRTQRSAHAQQAAQPRRPLHWGRALAWLVLGLFILLSVFPLLWMLRTALTPAADIFDSPGNLLPAHASAINFERVLGRLSLEQAQAAGGSGASIDFLHYLRNTVIVMVLTVTGQVACSVLAAYAFARLEFPLKNLIFTLFLGVLMVPGIVTLIPNFILIRDLGWLNSFLGIVAPFFLFAPVSIFFMRQYFLGQSREIEEAARIDGAGTFTIFWRVALPMAVPGISTLALINALGAWGEYLWPLLAGRGEETRTLTVALSVFRQQSPSGVPDFTGLMAASSVAILPIFFLLVILGRRMLDSLGGFSGLK
ncbi:carbohydrate ABC transporter permease [Deinococcus sp.]|uniref:carbohydrate ABC transporter permease n=1 Tax=Deinococcus sp. TaxID=47478 RepID=UPI003CC65BFC